MSLLEILKFEYLCILYTLFELIKEFACIILLLLIILLLISFCFSSLSFSSSFCVINSLDLFPIRFLCNILFISELFLSFNSFSFLFLSSYSLSSFSSSNPIALRKKLFSFFSLWAFFFVFCLSDFFTIFLVSLFLFNNISELFILTSGFFSNKLSNIDGFSLIFFCFSLDLIVVELLLFLLLLLFFKVYSLNGINISFFFLASTMCSS